MFVIYGHVLHRLREHLNVPGSSSVDKEPLTRELRRLLSRLNETSGGFSKIVAVSGFASFLIPSASRKKFNSLLSISPASSTLQ